MPEIPGGCKKCGCPEGYLKTHDSGIHVGLYCSRCSGLQKWVSKRDAGLKPRSMASRAGVSPSLRQRVFSRDGHRCVMCGVAPPGVHLVIGHIVSVQDGVTLDIDDSLVNSYWNLCCMCEECNTGLGRRSMALPDALRIYHRYLVTNEVADAS